MQFDNISGIYYIGTIYGLFSISGCSNSLDELDTFKLLDNGFAMSIAVDLHFLFKIFKSIFHNTSAIYHRNILDVLAQLDTFKELN